MVQRGMMSLVLACVCIVLAQDADVINPVKLVQEASQDTDIGKIEIKEVSPTNEIDGVIPRMNVQGYLLDNNGNPVNSNVPFVFRIYDNYSGGNLLWGPEYDTINCYQGLFNERIGRKIPISQSVFTSGTYRYLEIQVNGQNMGRIEMTSSAYAFASGKSDTSAYAYNADKLDNYHAGNGTGRIPISNSTRCIDLNTDMLDYFHAGNSSGQIPVSNSSRCVNLNADLLDGYHSSSFLSTASDYGRSGVSSTLYEGTIPLINKYIDGVYSSGSGLSGGGTSGNVTISLNSGNNSGQIPVSNSSRCVNLNADLLDGYHSSSFLSTASDYGRSGVSSTLYEGSTAIANKYVNETGDDMTGALNMYASINMYGYSVVFRSSGGTSRGYIRGNNTYDQLDIVPAGSYVVVSGNMVVTGNLSKGSGSFLIDHPLDPLNKTLRHNFVESPENLCLYRGKATLDSDGKAIVTMPSYFITLTKENEATVILTPIGAQPFLVSYAWDVNFAEFTVYGEKNREVSYTVLADRDDPVMRQLYKPVEEEKGNGNSEKGKLFYPEAYGYPKEMGMFYDGNN